MSYKIAIASGKGGTGKTSVSVSLFHFLGEKFPGKLALADCDVEEPNDSLFFKEFVEKEITNINQRIPEIDNNSCTYCRKCVEYCEFNAITVIPPVPFAAINNSLCHSCGACLEACEFDALTEKDYPVGTIKKSVNSEGNILLEGRLKIGSAMQTLLIRELKKYSRENAGEPAVQIYDSPPGTSCPVVETVSDTDYIILVTEPTPFGMYDLKLSIEMLKEINIPFGVVVNKAGIGDNSIYHYLNESKIELLGKIPFSRIYASNYAQGKILKDLPSEIFTAYHKITDVLIEKMR
jgi:MinD superfamily P-loop ATPase